MGLLTEGEALSWEETKKHAKHVQEHGIQQFINLYQKLKDRKNDELKWGDEVSPLCEPSYSGENFQSESAKTSPPIGRAKTVLI